jgi:diaminopropionate ammonia-lyase
MDPIFKTVHINHLANTGFDPVADYPHELSKILGPEMFAQAQNEIIHWEDYQPTPLYSLEGLAKSLGVKAIFYKDEGLRFAPGSFKALGGAYEVQNLLRQQVSKHLGSTVTLEDIRMRKHLNLVQNITVATATDGNHGRSVAWGAQRFGCPCKIYIHAHVSEGRLKAMEAYGAEVIRVTGNYDDSVRQAATDAEANGWFIVSDTSYEGYTELPRHVMAGYTVMLKEILDQLPSRDAATHIFVQGGCGGLAGAVCGYLWSELGEARPRFSIIEPVQADCLYQSGQQGKQVDVNIKEESLMAGLSCGEVSTVAWEIIQRGTNDFLSMHDELVGPTMRLLAKGDNGAQPIVAGESAIPGLAIAIAGCKQEVLKSSLALDEDSVIVLLGTEGATDQDIYLELVGNLS